MKNILFFIIFILSIITGAGYSSAEDLPDTTAPQTPLLAEYLEGELELRGMAESSSTIIVKVEDIEIGRGTVNSDGFFKITIIPQPANTTLTITAIDNSNNRSQPALITVTSKIQRISGANRYLTAIEISKEAFPYGADTVVLVRGDDFPDALAAGPLAYRLKSPILSTPQNILPEEVKNEIIRLKAEHIIIIGGDGAISKQIEKTLLNTLKVTVERIAGVNRYDTAAKIADRIGVTSRVVLAYGRGFADALSISPYAARNGMPILLTETKTIPTETKRILDKAEATFVVGGEGVISDVVLAHIQNGIRISGATRFETNAKILELFGSFTNKAIVATGRNYADALAGSVLAARLDSPILLVERDFIPNPIQNWLQSYGQVKQYKILGGQGVLSEQMANNLPYY
jgi:putative cell wall-binding protein